jgi:DNA-binding transcriptional MerR regulator
MMMPNEPEKQKIPAAAPYSIGMLARVCAVKIATIRYYEHTGLLAPAVRTAGGQRRFTRQHKIDLDLIRHSRDLGFDMPQIRSLLAARRKAQAGHIVCAESHGVVENHIAEVQHKIQQLQALAAELQAILAAEHTDADISATTGSCHVLQRLTDHTLCQSQTHERIL